MADAGRAMMLYRGMYDSTYTYEKLDVVNFNGSLYISTTDGNLGTEPTEETKWKLFLQGGVADDIRATDTYGLVGEAGGSSFVQLLLDSLASRVGKDGNGNVIEDTYIPQNATLNTLEEIDANTSEENIAGALAIKSLNSKVSDLTNNSGYYLGTTGSLTLGADETITIPDLTDYKFLLFVFNGKYVAEFVPLLELRFTPIDKFSRKTVQDGYYFNLKVILVEGGINIKIEEIAGYSHGAVAIYGLK